MLLALPRIAEAQVRPRVIVEISAKAERYLDSRLTRRLVEIELSDAEVPLRSGDKSEKRPTVYFRVLATSPDALRVELWDVVSTLGTSKSCSHGASRWHPPLWFGT